MKNTQRLINLFKKNSGTVNLNLLSRNGFDEHSFAVAKHSINHSKAKWRDYKVIRKGKIGKSFWTLAEIDPKSSIHYTKMMMRGAIKKVIFSSKTNLIAVAGENNAIERMNLKNQITQTYEKFLKTVSVIL